MSLVQEEIQIFYRSVKYSTTLLNNSHGLFISLQVVDKNSLNALNSAARELRRNYSKKVADKLAFLTKTSLKVLSKHFAAASMESKSEDAMDDSSVKNIVFVLTAYLSIPEIEVRPSIDEVQVLILENQYKIEKLRSFQLTFLLLKNISSKYLGRTLAWSNLLR